MKIALSRFATDRPAAVATSAMRSLKDHDLRQTLAAIHELYVCDAQDGFAFRLMSLLLDLVPAQSAGLGRVQMRSTEMLRQTCPKKALEPFNEVFRQNFMRFQDQHPFLSLFRKTGGFGPTRFSDLISQRDFERLPIYNEYYRPSGSRFQIEFTLPAPRDVWLVLMMDHPDKNFSERDRAVLTLLRPHVAVADRAVETRLACTALAQCVDPRRGAAFLSTSGRLRHLTPTAEALLSRYFGESAGDKLPDEIRRWLRHRNVLLASDGCLGKSPAPLIVNRGALQLEIEACQETKGQVLLLRERNSPASPASLTALGLTPRQAEVLYWIAQGKTNSEIGMIVGASHHTIHQHVNAILKKVGVENRAAAMLRALEVLGLPPALGNGARVNTPARVDVAE